LFLKTVAEFNNREQVSIGVGFIFFGLSDISRINRRRIL